MRFSMRGGIVLGVALVLAPPARAADRAAAIDRAVERAVAHIKSQQGQDGLWKTRSGAGDKDQDPGATALCGIALLEGDVPRNDPAIQKAARALREASVTCTYTYSLSLMIMFLERLGDPADAELIESLAVRLLAGQDALNGGWSYDCPALSAEEVKRLQGQLRQRTELVAKEPPQELAAPRPFSNLTPEIQQQVTQVARQGAGNAAGRGNDNSNTQFAILALWIARRQGIPIDAAMRRIDGRFRASQISDGGWGYLNSTRPAGMPAGILPGAGGPPAGVGSMMGAGSTPAMTCAGLLGLALSYGTTVETTLHAGTNLPGSSPAPRRPAIDVSKDPVVQNGLRALAASLTQPFEGQEQRPNGGRGNFPNSFPGAAPPGAAPPGGPQLRMQGNKGYYFLFSLERVGVAYGLDTFGGKNWYEWGSDILLRNQGGDGSWTGAFAEACSDTCFGVLFLRRANLAPDLTLHMKRVLKAGGGSGADLLKLNHGSGAGGARSNPPPADSNPPAGRSPAEARPSPAPTADAATAKLGDELINAAPAEQDEVLTRLRDTKGAEYTDALAYAIHKLSGPAKAKARDALADRLTRMSAKTLTNKLEDDNFEVRRAAALAVAMKEEKPLVPRLIQLLEDPEAPVGRAAHAALKSLTGQDFGPDAEASRAEVGKSVAAWKDWWSKNGGR